VKLTFLVLVTNAALMAQIGVGLPGQYPGQYPPGGGYPGGGYPGGGRYPNGGQGTPAPTRGSRKNTDQKSAAAQSRTYSGVIRRLDAKSFDLELEDTRFLIVQYTDSTPKPASLRVGDGVDVDATEDKDAPFQAVSIKPNSEIARVINANDQLPAEPEEQQERTGPPPTIMVRRDSASADDDGGPPKLKRGKPAPKASSSAQDDDTAEVASLPPAPEQRVPTPSPANSRQQFVEKAREVAATFLEGLPNYVCQEVVTRYVSETRVPSWNVIDVVSGDMVWEEGKESYRNITINGKASKKPPEDSGAWSTGEFGTILAALFSPGTKANFKYVEDATIARLPASVYDFAVVRLRSAWNVHTPGQYINAPYKGSVWIDKQSAHALRIEMQAKDIPTEFPLVNVETAVDYEYVTLGTPEKFLLPVHAEILSCDRGSNECGRNVIEFRNYHKFTGESTIKFGEDPK